MLFQDQLIIMLCFIISIESILLMYALRRITKIKEFNMGIEIGKTMPMIDYNTLKNKSGNLQSLYKDKKEVLLVFLGVNCPICAKLVKELENNYKSFSDRIKLISYGEKDEVEKWCKNNGFTSDIAVISQEVMKEQLHISVFPFASVVDNSGQVIKKGLIFEEFITQYIN